MLDLAVWVLLTGDGRSEGCESFISKLGTIAILILTPHLRPVTLLPLSPVHLITKQRKDITMKNSKSAPASVASLLGKKLNKIHVLKFNEKKSKPGKPVVDCKCLACGKPFSVGPNHLKYWKGKQPRGFDSFGLLRAVGEQ